MNVLLLLFISFSAFSQNKVIYGVDNRRDVFEETNPEIVELSNSVAAKIPNLYMRAVGKDMYTRTIPLRDRGMCPSERFSHQTTVAMCTAFLIGEKLLLTAGHCVTSVKDCKNNKWAFDYKVANATQAKVVMKTKDVYSCKKILAQKFDDIPGEDYAVIELDRKVKDRKPLRLNKDGNIRPGADVLVIGFPSSLPMKIADGARVRSVDQYWFNANLDTFGGNSGSPVFNSATKLVEGILVRGETDYVEDPAQGGCKVSNVCADDACSGESANFIPKIPLIKKL